MDFKGMDESTTFRQIEEVREDKLQEAISSLLFVTEGRERERTIAYCHPPLLHT
jgi:hypothetical protein